MAHADESDAQSSGMPMSGGEEPLVFDCGPHAELGVAAAFIPELSIPSEVKPGDLFFPRPEYFPIRRNREWKARYAAEHGMEEDYTARDE